MLGRVFARASVAAWLGVLLLSAGASAQSAITGLVKDSSGGVLPGVAVEASSPALIEKVRAVVTDTQGRYAIVDLRPGLYKVTFTLQGFSTFVQDRIELPSDFTATVNADLPVGGIEEQVTVSGASPVVDVQNAQRTTILNRQLLDAVPVPRMYQAEGALAVGTKVSDQNVGGARAAVNPRLTAHMSVTKDTTIDVDGMKMNTLAPRSQRRDEPGDHGADRRARRRGVGRRAAPESHPARGRQHVQRRHLPGIHGQLVSKRQPVPEPDRSRPEDAGCRQQDLRREPVARRTAQARQAVVLRVVPQCRQRQRRRQQLLSGRQPGHLRSARPQLHAAADVADQHAEQDHRVRRLSVEVRRTPLHVWH
ncbi:MAG: carboxypeptidase-like regulatory domain-containing protein [Acidobacteriia bacterium]|nr:carboxypeptidase-like regulatory domain-containing protein [Terriglobia bacterium]